MAPGRANGLYVVVVGDVVHIEFYYVYVEFVVMINRNLISDMILVTQCLLFQECTQHCE